MSLILESVSRETLSALHEFQNDLLVWSNKINLIAPSTEAESWNRHIVDSAQLLEVQNPSNGTWCDLGSGGGLPALVVGIIQKEISPQIRVTMIEADKRKSAFLTLMSKKYGLNASVISSRIETTAPQNADIVSARALSELTKLLDFVNLHMKPDGHAVLLKGRNYENEIKSAQEKWNFDIELHPSYTDTEARILRISNLRPALQI